MNDKPRAIYQYKRAKKDTLIKSIICRNNYELILIKSYPNITKTEAKTEMEKWRKSYIEIQTTQTNKFIKEHTDGVTLHDITKQASLTYGLSNEFKILDYINTHNSFNSILTKTKHIYAKMDFYDTNCYMYELKSLTYSVDKYSTAIMNYSKLVNRKNENIYKNIVFLFEYTNEAKKELYYHIYDPLNNIYNCRTITPRNRKHECLVFDIPISELTRIYDDTKIILQPIESLLERESFRRIIDIDSLL
jgi:hypothetical protein